ncbi:amidohydrolase family protein [Robiginitalea sp. M366]|uniref:amidohydrolase family protein n=1 Tax=Robiginitalea aestuariiviva TaxID=3036903 RepID=UPI00240D8CC8|nr:amidohydrolase family protein [Robiginitalea aestuariiviva]MDG1573444.1 amidohydrolase family protein [Robiginitalea aestuariiviva]
MNLKVLCGILLPALLAAMGCRPAPASGPESETAMIIRNVHIVDVERGLLLEHQAVVIDSGRIVRIARGAEVAVTYATEIDGQGGYLMPGLTEMHAHIPSPPADPQWIRDALYLYLSQGVTTIRGMLGHPAHLELREQAENGELPSPRIYTSSPSLNGNTVPDTATAAALVRQYAREGYDFLKIHPGIPRPAFDALVATAQEEGIPYAGHVPVDVGIRQALESGYATVDHVDGYLEGLVPEKAGVAPDQNGFFGFNFTDLADTTRLEGLLQLTRENGVWIVPTQSLFERWFAPTTADSLLAQPEMQFMPQTIRDAWARNKAQYMNSPNWDPERWARFDQLRLWMIRRLHQDGHGLLLGSDAPQVFNVPGFSLRHEMAGMLRAGIPLADILKMGTLEPAFFFGIDGETGSVEVGKKAELVLLATNPLEDPDALGDIRGVMRQGQWHSQTDLAAGLEAIAQRYAQNGAE